MRRLLYILFGWRYVYWEFGTNRGVARVLSPAQGPDAIWVVDGGWSWEQWVQSPRLVPINHDNLTLIWLSGPEY